MRWRGRVVPVRLPKPREWAENTRRGVVGNVRLRDGECRGSVVMMVKLSRGAYALASNTRLSTSGAWHRLLF